MGYKFCAWGVVACALIVIGLVAAGAPFYRWEIILWLGNVVMWVGTASAWRATALRYKRMRGL